MSGFRTIFQIEITVDGVASGVADVSLTEAIQKFLKAIQDRSLTISEIESAKVEIIEENTETWKRESW